VEEYFLAFSRTDKPKPTVTNNSLDCPLHGHLGQRSGIFAPGRQMIGQPAREVTSRTHFRNFTNTEAPCQRSKGDQGGYASSLPAFPESLPSAATANLIKNPRVESCSALAIALQRASRLKAAKADSGLS
jgi:hypothetical protein